MSVETITFDATRLWRFEDLAEIDDERHRYEIGDGVLEVTPPPVKGHDQVIANLVACLAPQVPAGLRLGFGPGIVVGRSVRIPDLSVVAASSAADEEPHAVPGEMVLAAEVVSVASRATDRLVKPGEYAAARISLYLRIERAEGVIVCYELADGDAYRIAGTYRPGQTIRRDAPFPLVIDVAAVLA